MTASSRARFHGQPVRLVLFDLDGTLADTAPDLAYALNQTLLRHGRPSLPFERIRPHVSHGGAALVRFGFDITPDHPDFELYRQDLLAIYQANLTRETTLFPGMGPVLKELQQASIAWGIVTNKPSWLTDPLVTGMGLSRRAACVVSGDTTAHSKPHPEPILHACRIAQTEPAACLYVGDAERDIIAGRKAGTHTLAALFGYLGDEDRPREWGADDTVSRPGEILDKLGLALPVE